MRCWSTSPSRAAAAAVTFWPTDAAGGGYYGWLARCVRVLLLPLGVLRLGSVGPVPLPEGALGVLTYPAVGPPFVFFVLAVRQFFRSPLHGSSPQSRALRRPRLLLRVLDHRGQVQAVGHDSRCVGGDSSIEHRFPIGVVAFSPKRRR